MENFDKKIIIGIITLFCFLVSLILFSNDMINYFIILATITVVLFVLLCYEVFKVKKTSERQYNKELNELLKRYDSILVYCDDEYEIDGEVVVFVKNFDDIVKYCDEINKTIVYVKEEDSSAFFLKNSNELLVYIMKKNPEAKSKLEQKIDFMLENSEAEEDDSDILDDIEKTTIIKLKNNKIFKVSPMGREID